MELSEGQREALIYALQMAGVGGLLGGGLRLGAGVVRNMNPRYDAPEASKPIVVDIPYPTDHPIKKKVPVKGEQLVKKANNSPAIDKGKELFTGNWEWPSWVPTGISRNVNSLWNQLPEFTPPEGPPDAQTRREVPIWLPLALAGGLGGGYLGYRATDRLVRAAERHRARKELESAQQEYQDAVLEKTRDRTFDKMSSDIQERIKVAIDKSIDSFEKINQKMNNGHVKSAKDDGFTLYKLVRSLMFPGLASGDPALAALNMAVVGGAAGLGGYSGYNYIRDWNAKKRIRDQIKAVDEANARDVPAPMIGRLVPVPRT